MESYLTDLVGEQLHISQWDALCLSPHVKERRADGKTCCFVHEIIVFVGQQMNRSVSNFLFNNLI